MVLMAVVRLAPGISAASNCARLPGTSPGHDAGGCGVDVCLLMRFPSNRYGEIVRTTVDLPEPLIQNARLLAGERGVTFSAVVEDALRGHLSPQVTEVSRKVQLPTVRGRPVSAEFDLDRTSAVEVIDDEALFASGGKR